MRRRFMGSGSRFDSLDEASPLDLNRAPADNMREVLHEITKKGYMSTAKKMGYVNNFTQLIQNTEQGTDFGLSIDHILICLRVCFFHPAKEVRAAGIRACRHLFWEEEILKKMIKLRIDIFVARSLDRPQVLEVERVQALRFIRKVIALCPYLLPMSLASALCAVSSVSTEEDRLNRACLATMSELAIKNTELASYCGGIPAIIKNSLDCQLPKMNEALMSTILYLINHPLKRCYVRNGVELEAILAPFTDLHYRHFADTPESHMQEDREIRIQSSRLAVISVFRSWAGIISLCKPDGTGLQSLLGILCLPDSDVKKTIMSVLFEIFHLQTPDWTDDFVVALASVDPSRMQDSWKLSEGFVAEEAKAVLPHRATGRTNLVDNYRAILLAAFLNAGILESLVEVIISGDELITVRATILLAEVLHMANTLLPSECSNHSHCLPTLMNLATSFEVTAKERGRASCAVNCLDRFHQMKKRGPIPCSLFLELVVTEAEAFEPKKKQEALHKKRLMACLDKEVDETYFSVLRDTQVLGDKNFRHWDWELIDAILQSPIITLRRLEETSNLKFARRLLDFYKPSSKMFCEIEIKDRHARKYSLLAVHLIDFMLEGEANQSAQFSNETGRSMVMELAQEIGGCLSEISQGCVTSEVLSNHSLNRTLSRDYMLIVGKLSCFRIGCRMLEQTGIYQYLLEICTMSSRDSLSKLIVASLDYSQPHNKEEDFHVINRVILAKVLTAGELSTKLYATRHLRALLRGKVPSFHQWGIELLVTQLYDPDKEVAMKALDILDEACEDEINLQHLIYLRPALSHLEERAMRLLVRFLSVEKGFKYLTDLNYIQPLMHQWVSVYNKDYVNTVEAIITESLMSYQKPPADGTYIRRTGKRAVHQDAFVPSHFFGEVVQQKLGFKLLKKTNYVEDFVRTLRTTELITADQILTVKSVLWALGHMGTSSWGLSLLVQEDVIPDIIRMAEECEVFSVRGTCFYTLGLIAKTRKGADILSGWDWECLRHKGEEQWPVADLQEDAMSLRALVNEQISTNSKPYSTTHREDSLLLNRPDDRVWDKPALVERELRMEAVFDDNTGVYLGEEMVETRSSEETAKPGGLLARLGVQDDSKKKDDITTGKEIYDKVSGIYLGEETPEKATPPEEKPGRILSWILEDRELREKFSQNRNNLTVSGLPVVSRSENDLTKRHSDDKTTNNARPKYQRAVSENKDSTRSLNVDDTFQDPLFPVHHQRSVSDISNDTCHVRSGSSLSDIDMGQGYDTISVRDRAETGSTFSFASSSGYGHDSYLTSSSYEPRERSATESSRDDSIFEMENGNRGMRERSATESSRDDSIFDTDGTSLTPSECSGSVYSGISGNLLDVADGERTRSNSSTSTASIGESQEVISADKQQERRRSSSLTEKTGTSVSARVAELRSASFSGSTDTITGEVQDVRGSRCYSESKIDTLTRESERPRSTSTTVPEESKDMHGSGEVHIVDNRSIYYRSSPALNTTPSARQRAISLKKSREHVALTGNGRKVKSSEKKSGKMANIKTIGDLVRQSYDRTTSMSSSSSESSRRRRRSKHNSQSSYRTVLGHSISHLSFQHSVSVDSAYFTLNGSSPGTSSRDVFGYGALSNLRRNRSFNRDLEVVIGITKPLLPPSRPANFGLSKSETVMINMHDNISSVLAEASSIERAYDLPKTTGDSEFLGLALPMDISRMFQVSMCGFKGSWADNFVPDPTSRTSSFGNSDDVFFSKFDKDTGAEEHDPATCLKCMITHSPDTPTIIVTDANGSGKPNLFLSETGSISGSLSPSVRSGDTPLCNSSMTDESVLQDKRMDETHPMGKKLIRKEVLKLVISLSSAVASKAHQQGLLTLKEKCPQSFQDLCLYSEVVNHLSLYHFRLSVRRFVQSLFENVNFSLLIEQSDAVLQQITLNNKISRTSSPLTSTR